jgi:spore germination cell wall hydrolase CwlJ-like protein
MTTLMCMALAIHFESRGESIDGKRMVGEVVMNRVEHKHFPDTVCGVVFSKSKSGKSCAFSWTCDGKSDTPNLKNKLDKEDWQETQELAAEVLAKKNELGTSALYFHNTKMKKPSGWKKMKLLGKVGGHIFYR